MKKFLFSAAAILLLAFAANSQVNMCIEKIDGSVLKIKVDSVSQVTYEDIKDPEVMSVTGNVGEYSFVDLGLQSKILWATCNVGATKPEEKGVYYQWGARSRAAFEDYSSANYQNFPASKKYSAEDGKRRLEFSDDAAIANMGLGWRMPTEEEMQELIDGCDWTWTDDYNGTGVAGKIGVSKKNRNKIFFPAAGYMRGEVVKSTSKLCCYWTASMRTNTTSAASAELSNSQEVFYDTKRYDGLTVRAVTTYRYGGSTQLTLSGYDGNGLPYVDLGLKSGNKWAVCNLEAIDPTDFGGYFAWGETTSRNTGFNPANYAFYSSDGPTKYRYETGWAEIIPSDGKTVLESEDDAASVILGAKSWKTPTDSDWQELIDGCVWTWESNLFGTGVSGYIGCSKNNHNYIFLPAAGYYYSSNTRDDDFNTKATLTGKNEMGLYWTANLTEITQWYSLFSYFSITDEIRVMENGKCARYHGLPIRAVMKK